MSNTFMSQATLNDMRKNAERIAQKTWQGQVAGPRVFQKHTTYTAEELRRNWRATIWDTIPSLMAGKRVPR